VCENNDTKVHNKKNIFDDDDDVNLKSLAMQHGTSHLFVRVTSNPHGFKTRERGKN
jgi:hypothetical protein